MSRTEQNLRYYIGSLAVKIYSISNNFREIQKNLEVWLARIIGDVERILARDGAYRVSCKLTPALLPSQFKQRKQYFTSGV